ncbi:MAG: hypothetical protein ACE5I5_08980 [Candidatus Heimdallarchaeota archaeon]
MILSAGWYDSRRFFNPTFSVRSLVSWVNKYEGANMRTLLEVKQELMKNGHPQFPAISENDWLMTSHFDSGVCNATYRVCGLGSWRGLAIWADRKKGLCAFIDPQTTIPERTVWLRKVI